jgi:hypothetical protein
MEDGRQDVGEPADVRHRRAGIVALEEREEQVLAVDLLLRQCAVEELLADIGEVNVTVFLPDRTTLSTFIGRS